MQRSAILSFTHTPAACSDPGADSQGRGRGAQLRSGRRNPSAPSLRPSGPLLAAVLRGAALTALLGFPLAADVLTVGPAGSGAQFTEISAAVGAAQPGDKVLVAPGAYGAFVVDKAVTVIGAGHEHVTVDQGLGVAGLRVVGLGALEAAHVSGLTVRATWGVSTAFPQVEVAQNAGRVVLSDVHAGTVLLPGTAGVASGPTAVVVDSDAVLLDGCFMRGLDPAYISQVSGGAQIALRVTGSSVWIADTRLLGASGGQGCIGCSYGYGPGASALIAVDSDLVMARCYVVGGAGGVREDFFEPSFSLGFDGAAGILLQGAGLVLAGGPGNLVLGGPTTLFYDFWSHYPPPTPGSGVLVDGASTVRAAADADVQNGWDAYEWQLPGGYEVLAGGMLVEETYPLPTADLQPTLASPGESVVLSISGTPDTLQLAFWSTTLNPFAAAHASPLPPGPGSFALPLKRILAVLATDGDGLGSSPIKVPPTLSIAGATLVAQTVEFARGPRAVLRLSNPTTLAIR